MENSFLDAKNEIDKINENDVTVAHESEFQNDFDFLDEGNRRLLESLHSIIKSEEWLDLLSEDGTVIGGMTRKVMRANGMLHKATYLIVHNLQNQILVQKRTMTKDFYPGYWDTTAGGVVQQGESILMSMKREAEEELGICDTPFVSHGKFNFSTEKQNIIGYLYSCISTGPFDLQLSEIEEVKWMSIDDIISNEHLFTKDSIYALKKWVNRE